MKKLTEAQKIEAILDLLETNGITIPATLRAPKDDDEDDA